MSVGALEPTDTATVNGLTNASKVDTAISVKPWFQLDANGSY